MLGGHSLNGLLTTGPRLVGVPSVKSAFTLDVAHIAMIEHIKTSNFVFGFIVGTSIRESHMRPISVGSADYGLTARL
jgi:hypothetical protein